MDSDDQLSDREVQGQIAEQVRRWRGRTINLGLGLIVSVLLWTPFFEGGPRLVICPRSRLYGHVAFSMSDLAIFLIEPKFLLDRKDIVSSEFRSQYA